MRPNFRMIAAAVVAALPIVGPAWAQANRTFVSGQGSDNNPCSLTAPCRSFQVAHNATNPKGEIVVLDSAGYGSVLISKSISIVNPGGVQAGITQPNGSAIVVTAGPNDTVSLRGLSLEGSGSDTPGIYFTSGLRLEINDCIIRNFPIGLFIIPQTFASVYITNTIAADNFTAGFDVNPLSQFLGSFDNITSINNGTGMLVSGTPELLITDSHVDNNVDIGVSAKNSNVVLRNTTINQTPTGIKVDGNSNVWLSQVTEANVPGLPIVSGVVFTNQNGIQHVYSDATNRLAGFSGGSPEVWFVQ